MLSRRFLPLLIIGSILAGTLVWAKLSRSPVLLDQSLSVPASKSDKVRIPYDPALVHKTLEFYAAQTRYDPGNATFRSLLAGQYLESYRETGDSADATRAEQAARASLGIRTHGNTTAYFQLARALLTQHRFPEALVAAREAAKMDPLGYRECADIEIEIGDYKAAARDLAKSPAQGKDPAYLSLRARFNELHGDSNGQLSLLRQAAQEADNNADLPAQTASWFHERLGRCLGMMGHLDEAEKNYLAGLQIFPRDYRCMAALAHLNAARGDWKQTITWGEKAANIVPAPETLALLGGAYTALRQPQKAAAQFRLVEQIGTLAQAQGIVYDRQRAMYYADHNQSPETAVKLARGELRSRHDIYAYDTLAWTLFKAGHLEEAAADAKRSLAFGTSDASLYFHAGMIAAAQKNGTLAQNYLSRALKINPYFDPSHPQEARKALARLGEAGSTPAEIETAKMTKSQ